MANKATAYLLPPPPPLPLEGLLSNRQITIQWIAIGETTPNTSWIAFSTV